MRGVAVINTKGSGYKIRDADGLYSQGGTSVRFAKHGKVWPTIGALKAHLRQFKRPAQTYEGCTVVRLDLVESSTCLVLDLVAEMGVKKR
jgi:hypothetical protein